MLSLLLIVLAIAMLTESSWNAQLAAVEAEEV